MALGTALAVYVHGDALTAVFAVMALIVALHMGLTGVDAPYEAPPAPQLRLSPFSMPAG